MLHLVQKCLSVASENEKLLKNVNLFNIDFSNIRRSGVGFIKS
jgi:hypothetical protein